MESYFSKKIDSNILRQYNAMKCASLLRETMWSMVSEITSRIEFNYEEYTKENLKNTLIANISDILLEIYNKNYSKSQSKIIMNFSMKNI